MKICFITNELFTVGGAQRVLSVLANNLIDKNEITIVWTGTGTRINRNLYNLNSKIRVENNIKLYSKKTINKLLRGFNKITGIFNRTSFEYIFKEIAYPKALQNEYIKYINRNEYDLVIGVGGYFSVILGIVSERISAKTIGWQHNSYEAYLENKYRYYWNEDILFEKYLPKLDKYIVLNNHDKEMFKSNKNIDCTVIYNPKSFKSNDKSEVIEKKFLAAGRFTYQKGFDLLLETFAEFSKKNNDWNLVIVGDGEEKRRLVELISKYNLQNRVVLKEFTDNIKKYFLESSALLLPSRWEGMPMIVLESLEMGVPVISYDITAIEPLIENGKEGFVIEKFNKNNFSKAMFKIASSVELRKSMSHKCLIKSKEFEEENIKNQWVRLLEEL